MVKTYSLILITFLCCVSVGFGQIIDFETNGNWVAGSGTLGSYQTDHSYTDQNWIFTGGPALKQTGGTQDGVASALGNASWRLRDASGVLWTATYNTAGTISQFGFKVRRWDSSPDPSYLVTYSTNGGTTYSAPVLTINNTNLGGTSDWYTFSYNIPSPVSTTAGQFIIKIERLTGERIMIDDFTFVDIEMSTDTVDWCNLQSPETGSSNQCAEYLVYAQIYEDGVTDAAGADSSIEAWIGYNTSDIDPSDASWTWLPASYNVQVGNNDEYFLDLGAELTATGTYYYASRFRYNSGPFIYGGYNSGEWDGTTNVNGVVTVSNEQVNFCNVDYPKTATINEGDTFTVYAQVYEPGITDTAGQGANIQAWIGYNTSGINYQPWESTGWTWVSASYDSDFGNNDQYAAEIGSGLSAGTYYFASRFQINCNDYSYGGIQSDNVGNFWDASNNNGVLTVTAPPTSTCVDEDFESGEPIDWSNNDSYYNTGTANSGTGKAGMNSTGDWIQTGLITNPAQLTFYGSTSSSSADYTLTIETSPDSSTWTNVSDLYADGSNTGDIIDSYQLYSFNLNLSGSYYIRWRISARSGGSFYLDDVLVTCGSSCIPTHSVTNFLPTSGPVGTLITITGTGFTSSSTVSFYDGINASIISQTATELIVEVPDGTSIGPITIEEDGCTIDTTDFTLINTSGSCSSLSDLIMTEIYDKSSGSLGYIEIYNGTGSTIDLSNYSIRRYGDATDLGNGEYTLYTFPTAEAPAIANGSVLFGKMFSPGNTDSDASEDFTYDIDCSFTGGNWSCGGFNGDDIFHLYNGSTLIDVYIIPDSGSGYLAQRNTNTAGPNNSSNPSDWSFNTTENTSDLGVFNFSGSSSNFPNVSTSPSDITCSSNAVFTTTATPGNSGTLSYTWYFNDGASAGWTLVNSTNLPLATLSGENTYELILSGNYYSYSGYQFYCLVTEDGACSQASDAAQLKTETTTWDGSVWDNGIPDINTVAIIDGNYNTNAGGVQDSFSACSMVVNSGYTLTISDAEYIEVENDLIVTGNIIVNPYGSFVQNNDLGTVTVANYNSITVEKFTAVANQWYEYTYWGSPVFNETIANGLAEGTPNRRFAFNAANYLDSLDEIGNSGNFNSGQDDIDDDANAWYYVSGSTVMEPGVGYASTLNSTIFNSTLGCPGCQIKYTFNGAFNNGVISVPVYRNDSQLNDHNWNFLGNPYPSAIDADLFLATNTTTVDTNVGASSGAIFFWSQHTPPSNGNSGNENVNFPQSDYAIINASGQTAGGDGVIPERFIPSCQGFFIAYDDASTPDSVSGDIATGHITFNNAMRVTGNNSLFFKNSTTTIDDKIWLNLTSDNGIFNQILVAYLEGATNGDDGMYYDAPRNLSTESVAMLYSLIDESNKKFAIQGKDLNSLNEDEIIPLGFFTSTDIPTTFSINIPQLQGDFLTSNSIYLKDNYLNLYHDLSSSAYTFISEPGEFNDRFEIVFQTTTLSTDDVILSPSDLTIIELPDGTVKFKVSKDASISQVEIIDVLGRRLYTLEGSSSEEVYFLPQLHQAAYVARVTLDNGQTLTKKAIKR